ncbi:MAG: hypothetical protein ABH827_00115 [bacterium]
MFFGLKRFLALVLFIGLFFENSAQSVPLPRFDRPGHQSTVSEKSFDWASAAKVAEFTTVALSIPAQAAYRTVLLKYEDGRRLKKPFFIKSLVSGLRILNGMLTLYNQGSVSNNIMRQRYAAFWVIMDTVQFFSNALSQDSLDTLKRYIPERLTRKFDELLSQDTQVADESLFAKINEFLNDDQYVKYLRHYVLPTLEESLLVWTALDTDSSEVAQKRKLYVAGVKGVCRCLEEILDTKDISARKFYIGVLVTHIISMGFDVFAPDCIAGQEKRKEEETKKEKEEKEKLERDKKKKNGNEKDEKKKDDNKSPKRSKDLEKESDDKSDDSIKKDNKKPSVDSDDSKKDDQDGKDDQGGSKKLIDVKQPEQKEIKEVIELNDGSVLPTEEDVNLMDTGDVVEQSEKVVREEKKTNEYQVLSDEEEANIIDTSGVVEVGAVDLSDNQFQDASLNLSETDFDGKQCLFSEESEKKLDTTEVNNYEQGEVVTDERLRVGFDSQKQIKREQVPVEVKLFENVLKAESVSGSTKNEVEVEDNELLGDGGDELSDSVVQPQAPIHVNVPVQGNADFEMNYRWPAKKIRKEFNDEVGRLKDLAVKDSVSLDELNQIQTALRSVDLMAIRNASSEKNWIKVRENELAPYEYILREISDRLEDN